MDPGCYEDLAGRLYGLLTGLEDRLNSDDAAIIHQFIGARHYGVPVVLAEKPTDIPLTCGGSAGSWPRRRVRPSG